MNKGIDKIIGIGSEISKYQELFDVKEKYFFLLQMTSSATSTHLNSKTRPFC